MSVDVILAVESVIPSDHPVAILAVPLGIVIFAGSVYLLLWSNYGAKKALAITGVAWCGFAAVLGVFWWFGAPGIPPGLGISHLPGQSSDHYNARWYPFEPDSERSESFESDASPDAFLPVHDYLGIGEPEDPADAPAEYTYVQGLLGQAVDQMQDQFLPVDDNGIAQIGADRRAAFEERAAEAEPADADGRAAPFFSAAEVGDARLVDDAANGVRLATTEFQVFANFTDADGVPLDPVPVSEPIRWFAFYDPGAEWLPSALWTGIFGVLFLASLAWLDRMEQREKRLSVDEVEEAREPAVPVAQ